MSNHTPIAPEFAAPEPTTLVFKGSMDSKKRRMSFSGNESILVYGADGKVMFESDAKNRRRVKNARGADIGQVCKKTLSDTYYLGTMNDHKRCSVKAKRLMNQNVCSADIYHRNTLVGNAEGDWSAKELKIMIDGNQAANVKRNAGIDSYCVEVAAKVDSLFISMIILALDQIYRNPKNNETGMSYLAPIAPNFAVLEPTTLVIKSKGVSKVVHQSDGNVLFLIDPKRMSMQNKRFIKDASGAEIGQVSKKMMPGIHVSYYLGTMNDGNRCALKTKRGMDPTHFDAEIYHNDARIGEASGNWSAKSFKIIIDGNKAAEIMQNKGVAESYCIELAEGVDSVFISLIVTALDEIFADSD